MSLLEGKVGVESGTYKDFNFDLRVLYDSENLPVSGVVYIRESKENRIASVELLVESLCKGGSRIDIDFNPLELSATKSNFQLTDTDGLFTEIERKWNLVNAMKNPEDSFLSTSDPRSYITDYPELAKKEYLDKLPKGVRTQ